MRQHNSFLCVPASFSIRFNYDDDVGKIPGLGPFSGAVDAMHEGYQDLVSIEPECIVDATCLAGRAYDTATDMALVAFDSFTDSYFPTQETRSG